MASICIRKLKFHPSFRVWCWMSVGIFPAPRKKFISDSFDLKNCDTWQFSQSTHCVFSHAKLSLCNGLDDKFIRNKMSSVIGRISWKAFKNEISSQSNDWWLCVTFGGSHSVYLQSSNLFSAQRNARWKFHHQPNRKKLGAKTNIKNNYEYDRWKRAKPKKEM